MKRYDLLSYNYMGEYLGERIDGDYVKYEHLNRTRTASRLRNERAKNRRKDEEIRLLREVCNAEECEHRGGGDYSTAVKNRYAARAALAEFDGGSK